MKAVLSGQAVPAAHDAEACEGLSRKITPGLKVPPVMFSARNSVSKYRTPDTSDEEVTRTIALAGAVAAVNVWPAS